MHTWCVTAREVPPVGDEPGRLRPDRELSMRMSRLARRHTMPELAVRRRLHALGLRYRVQLPVPGNRRRTIDIAFTRVRVAVFIDGCFWHGCPHHGVRPRTNPDWWKWKLERNRTRDADTTRLLADQGWHVLRFWEHDDPQRVADDIATVVRARSSIQRLRRRSDE